MHAPRVSVGLLHNPHVPRVLARAPYAVDHLSIVPDVLQVDRGPRRNRPAPGRFLDVEAVAEPVLGLARDWPMVGHGVGLSIGSPRPLDRAYLRRMRGWVERLGLHWYSEHLSFFRLRRGATAAHEAGLACPLPYDRPVLAAIARRAAAVQAALGVPFLLENGVSYVAPVDDDLDEPGFLNGLVQRAPVGLLLDLHNLHVNATNLGLDAAAMVDAIDGAAVREIHVAGGDTLLGYYTDAHSGAVPEPVWQLLRRLLPRLPALAAITFEYHESVGDRLGVDGVLAQLDRARDELARAGCWSGRLDRSHDREERRVAR
jgi:uncharacterized protein (UPF0276 family)